VRRLAGRRRRCSVGSPESDKAVFVSPRAIEDKEIPSVELFALFHVIPVGLEGTRGVLWVLSGEE